MRLENKVAIITGASAGIGKAAVHVGGKYLPHIKVKPVSL